MEKLKIKEKRRLKWKNEEIMEMKYLGGKINK